VRLKCRKKRLQKGPPPPNTGSWDNLPFQGGTGVRLPKSPGGKKKSRSGRTSGEESRSSTPIHRSPRGKGSLLSQVTIRGASRTTGEKGNKKDRPRGGKLLLSRSRGSSLSREKGKRVSKFKRGGRRLRKKKGATRGGEKGTG